MNWAMYQRTDQWAYRLVIVIQIVVPLIYIVGSFLLPESPRWLIGKGRDEDAEKPLKILRKNTVPAIIRQKKQLLVATEEDNKAQFDGSWFECFTLVISTL
jgi:hypothetical protein